MSHLVRIACTCIPFLLAATYSSADGVSNSFPLQYTNRVELKLSSSKILLPSGFVRGSDTVTVAGRVLIRSVEYSIDSQSVTLSIDSAHFHPDSTLLTVWVLKPEYLITVRSSLLGRPTTTEIISEGKSPRTTPDTSSGLFNNAISETQSKSDLRISGSKRVTVAGSSSGGNKLSQGLELTIGGHLSERVTVEGALSDEGNSIPASRFDAPTSSQNVARLNSTLAQLDRVHLQVAGPEVTLRLGDLGSEKRPEFSPGDNRLSRNSSLIQPSSLFGISAGWKNRRGHVTGTVARPRGRRTTIQIRGGDNLQGPYRITDRPGGSAIVPGSEQVWLNGLLLTRGVSEDYIADYTVGTIQFTTRRLIDSRSRIEIDFEQTSDAYRQEYLASDFGAVIGDSTFVVSVELQREHDNSSRPLADSSLSSTSDFGTIGDGSLVRSGIIADTAGDYNLVVDSLPDSVLVYVGRGSGLFTLRTTFVGAGKGSYRYLGDGRYQYAGVGVGDYLPIITLKSPERRDEFQITGQLRPVKGITSEFQHLQSNRDMNLLSGLDDGDNVGTGVRFSLQSDSSISQVVQFMGTVEYLDERFSSTVRFFEPDIARSYLMPGDSLVGGDRARQTVSAQISPIRQLRTSLTTGRYTHRDLFSADVLGMTAAFGSDNSVNSSLSLRFVDALHESTNRNGKLNEQQLSIASSANRALQGEIVARHESRKHDYDSVRTEAELTEISGNARLREWGFLRLTLQDVDSTRQSIQANRKSVQSVLGINRTFGALSVDGDLGWQSIALNESDDAAASLRVRLTGQELPNNLSWSVDYRLQRELATARGYAFLEVPSGEGEYRQEDSLYIPDPNGNFIRIEEIVSDSAVLSRGEKYARVDYRSKSVNFHASSEVMERRLDQSSRSLLWLLPWYSSERDAFQSVMLNREIRADLFERVQGYPLTIAWSEERESRSVVITRDERHDWRYSLTGRHWFHLIAAEVEGERYGNRRNSVYGLAGDIDGTRGRVSIRQNARVLTPHLAFEIRRAAEMAGDTLTQWRLTPGMRIFVAKSSGLRADGNFTLEWYRNATRSGAHASSLLLSGNRRGKHGAVLSLQGTVRTESGLSARLTVVSSYADRSRPIVSGRGEVVASF